MPIRDYRSMLSRACMHGRLSSRFKRPSKISRNEVQFSAHASRRVWLQQKSGAPFWHSFDACHRPVAMRLQQSPTHRMRSNVLCVVNKFENQNACDVVCARAQVFLDQVCGGCHPCAERYAPSRKVNGKLGIVRELYRRHVSPGTCL